MRETAEFLPVAEGNGVGDHAQLGGGAIGAGLAFYPSTALRAVPLPIYDGEDLR